MTDALTGKKLSRMDFNLTVEHQQAKTLAREFAGKEVAPIIKEADRNQEMPDFILPRLGELGFLGLCIPAGRAWIT